MRRFAPVPFAVVLALPAQPPQARPTHDVALTAVRAEGVSGNAVQFDGDTWPLATADKPRTGRFPGGVAVRVEALAEPAHAYRVLVDADHDGDFANDKPNVLAPGGSCEVRLTRKQGSVVRELDYKLEYTRQEPDGQRRAGEWLMAFQLYRAEGRLRVGDRDLLLVCNDLQADGDFDANDLLQGTAIGVDLDGDGRIWGASEYYAAGQILTVGNLRLVAVPDSIAADGTLLRLFETELAVPEVGKQAPAFALALQDGSTFDRSRFAGKRCVLDFWASWCAPCVAKLPAMQQLAAADKDLAVVYCSIDRSDRVAKAGEVVQKLGLPAAQVACSGRGEQEMAWQLFGSMLQARMNVPLYVLIDADGVLRYVGHGGTELVELQQALAASKPK